MTRKAKAFSPAGISSFFEICDETSNGKLILDPERVGARGGGFAIKKGVLTSVDVSDSEEKEIHVFINGKPAPEAETSKEVAKALIERREERNAYKVVVRHEVEIPVGAGFGSSAAGALGVAFALNKALNLNLTYNQLGRIAHVAEVKCRTGLGTVGPLMLGGCVVTIEPGAPGYALIDRIPIPKDYVIVAGVFGSIPTKEILSSPERREAAKKWGRKTLEKILAEPSPENFLRCCKEFAEKTGFMTSRVRKLIKLAEEAGAIGAAQNMVGEAVHALVPDATKEKVLQAFKKVLPENNILVAEIDLRGARLIG